MSHKNNKKEIVVKMFVKMSVCAVTLGAGCACAAGAKTVKVSDFGWNAEDATEIVQAAINSDARCVIFDKKESPWIVRPIKGRSNIDIVFEDGAELLAKKGEFHGIRDYLLDMTYATNFTITGMGKTGGILRMRKADYQKPPYARSEWRYALSLLGVENAKIENMSFIASGGDGICTGRKNCRNIVIRRCRFLDNHRQGISVCSATNLLIEDCVLSNTSGTPPAAGIDFEPDGPDGCVSNCILRNCRLEGNRGKGVDIYLANQNANSKPISIWVENCHIAGNTAGTDVTVGGGKGSRNGGEARGSIVFTNCTFDANRGYSIVVARKPTEFKLVFADCVISNQNKGVSFFNNKWNAPIADGVEFRNLKSYCKAGEDWYTPDVNNRGLNATIPTNIFGNVTVVRPDGSTDNVVLDQDWRTRTFSLSKPTPPARMKGLPKLTDCKVQDSKPGELVPLAKVELMHHVYYALFADKPGEVRFRARQVSKYSSGEVAKKVTIMVRRTPGDTKDMARLSLSGKESAELSFTAPRRGFYFLFLKNSFSRLLIEAANVPTAIYVGVHQQQGFISDRQVHSLYASVAPNTDRFAFVAKGGSDGALGAELFDPDGVSVAKELQVKGWEVLQKSSPAAGLWRIDLSWPKFGPRRYFQLDLVGVPGFLWLSKEKTVMF